MFVKSAIMAKFLVSRCAFCSFWVFYSVNHFSGPLRKCMLLARVQKVIACDSLLVDLDPFCFFRVSRFVAFSSSCVGQ